MSLGTRNVVSDELANLGTSYATERSQIPGLLACQPMRALTGLLLFRVNVLTAVGGPWGPLLVVPGLRDGRFTALT
jgi:hypothetical protein